MARQEQDREDLLAEATALVERAELAMADRAEHVIVGFRRDGCASLYFSPDEAWHFNSRSQLRRAYLDGRLLKAEHGKLVVLVRERSGGEVQLVRHELSAAETTALLDELAGAMTSLHDQLLRGAYQLIGEVPAGSHVARRTQAWLQSVPHPPQIADQPNAL